MYSSQNARLQSLFSEYTHRLFGGDDVGITQLCVNYSLHALSGGGNVQQLYTCLANVSMTYKQDNSIYCLTIVDVYTHHSSPISMLLLVPSCFSHQKYSSYRPTAIMTLASAVRDSKFSSTRAISPQCLDIEVPQRIFACTALLKISASIKTTHNFLSHFITFLQLLKY